MPQNVDKVLDHENLFREPEYKAMFDNKRSQFEFRVPAEELPSRSNTPRPGNTARRTSPAKP